MSLSCIVFLPLHHGLSPAITMHRFSLFLLVLAVPPLATTASIVQCIGNGVYTANSTYEANLRRLAAILLAETSSSQGLRAFRGVGYWPNRMRAFSRCSVRGGAGSSTSCATCIADAFQEAERVCPYGKKVVVFGHDCSLSLADFPSRVAFGPSSPSSFIEILAPAMVLQAIGFAWLFFMLLQEWRDGKRGSMMRHGSLPSGDQ